MAAVVLGCVYLHVVVAADEWCECVWCLWCCCFASFTLYYYFFVSHWYKKAIVFTLICTLLTNRGHCHPHHDHHIDIVKHCARLCCLFILFFAPFLAKQRVYYSPKIGFQKRMTLAMMMMMVMMKVVWGVS